MDRVSHFEIPFTDQKRAATFYQKVFGWEITEIPGMPYWFATTTPVGENHMPKEPGAINGGFYERSMDASPNPMIVIEVADVAARVQEVLMAGGEIVFMPRQVGDMGLYAQVKDCEGNYLGLWQNLQQ
ncbi:MAG: VOC family protein [Zavarzinella sp.]